ncbi:MAG TPA: hypothetical protein VE011_12830 [Candidatus Dormibacteraeota bacterium]|nr:hypothetical protein [Candidatus Dormibacteraeota bacterium]
MTSTRTRTRAAAGRVLRGAAWTVLFTTFAVGGAGVIGESFHAAGSPARAELTWAGDAALHVRLAAATTQLQAISANVDALATDAKTALEEVASSDPTRLRDALASGGQAATTIATRTRDLKEALAALPGDGPDAVLQYSNATLVRRASIIAALDAASSLASLWQTVTGGAANAAHLINLIDQHDQTVLAAAAQGRDHQYRAGATTLDTALETIGSVQQLRNSLIASSGQTVLDEWISRTSNYDKALQALYAALDRSGGVVTLDVQARRRDEQAAFSQLPPDRRTIIVIVSEVARGGLTSAIIAIDEASARIDDALGGPS